MTTSAGDKLTFIAGVTVACFSLIRLGKEWVVALVLKSLLLQLHS